MKAKKEKKIEEKKKEEAADAEGSEREEEAEEEKMSEADMEKYTKITVYIIAAFVIVLLAWVFMVKVSSSFTYHNIPFAITKEGQIDFYTATIPVSDESGIKVAEMSIDFRNDPRKLEDIIVNASGRIDFLINKKLYVSLNSPLTKCENNGIALVNLGRFLSTIGHDIKSATANEDYVTKDAPYVTCENTPSNSVIIIKNGAENSITKISANCYVITAKDCDILRVLEKFELQVLQEALGY